MRSAQLQNDFLDHTHSPSFEQSSIHHCAPLADFLSQEFSSSNFPVFSPKYIHWKYFSQSTPSRSLLAISDGTIVGHHGSIQRTVRTPKGRARKADTVTADVITDYVITPPARSGFFQRTLEQEHNLRAQQTSICALGFPNEQLLRIGKRLLGYHPLSTLSAYSCWIPQNTLQKPFNTVRESLRQCPPHAGTWRLFFHPQVPKDFIVHDFRDHIESAASFWMQHKESARTAMLERSASYLRWRYLEEPHSKFFGVVLRNAAGIAGIGVARCRDAANGIRLCEIFECDGISVNAQRAVLSVLRSRAEDLGALVLRCWTTSLNTVLALRSLGFCRAPKYDLTFVAHPYPSSPASHKELLSPHWYLTAGDSDM